MLKWILVVVVLTAVGGGGFFLYQNFQTASPKESPGSSPIIATTPTPEVSPSTTQTSQDACQVLQQGSADVPSLYKEGITWQMATTLEYAVPLGEEGQKKMVGCLANSTHSTEDLALRVGGYYDDNLQKNGWKILVTASGSFSEIDSYRKGDKLFVVRYFVTPGTSPQTTNPPISIELFYSQ